MSKKDSHILVVDDELSMRELLEVMLQREGYTISCAENGQTAIGMLRETTFDLVLCDMRLGDIPGLDVLRAAKREDHHAVVIMISAYATTETAVEAMNLGAFDYVPKPFNNEELRQNISKALALKTIEHEKEILDKELRKTLYFGKIIGNHPGMMRVYDMIRQVAPTKTSVLITGESGTGKELIARALHDQSDRQGEPFVVINCAGIPETLMESELFGHKKGAFTGASQDKKGLFEIADRGTVFLDEIGEISLQLQVKLLRVIQERIFKAVGGTDFIAVDIRILSATNLNLEEEVIARRFREDLFYRLNVIEIKVPPLRERRSDLRLLAQHFLEKYSREMGKEISKISSYAIDFLNRYDFPGNVRELENLMERSVALSNTNIILPDSLALSLHKRNHMDRLTGSAGADHFNLDDVAAGVSLDRTLETIERAYIKEALRVSGDSKNKAAALLGISFRSLRYRLSKLEIEP